MVKWAAVGGDHDVGGGGMRITTLFLVAGLIMPGVATGQRAGPFIGGNERQVLTLQGRELWPWRRHERLHS